MKRAASLLFSLAVTASSPADLIVYEGFDYAAAPNSLVDQNGGIGWLNAWSGNGGNPDISLGSMTYTDLNGQTLLTSGNRAYFDATNPNGPTGPGPGETSVTASSFRTFDLSGVTESTLYFSLMGEQLTGDARATNFAFFSATSERISVGHGTGNVTNWGAFTDGLGGNGAYSSVSVFDPTFLVLRIDLNVNGTNDRVRLYVNPLLDAEPLVADVDFSDRNVVGSFTELTRARPFSGGSNTTLAAAQADYDELRIGTTYADVTPVPEPASAVMLAGGGLLLLGRRSRRQNR